MSKKLKVQTLQQSERRRQIFRKANQEYADGVTKSLKGWSVWRVVGVGMSLNYKVLIVFLSLSTLKLRIARDPCPRTAPIEIRKPR